MTAGYLAILADPTIARDYAASVTIYGSPNTVLDDDNILLGSMKYSESTASGREISIGTTVMSELNLTLLNLAGELDGVALQNSALLDQVGLMLDVDYYAKDGLSSQAQSVWATNLITNGNFSDVPPDAWRGIWGIENAAGSVSDNTLILTGNGDGLAKDAYQLVPAGTIGHKYYCSAKILVTDSACINIALLYDYQYSRLVYGPTANTWYDMSGIVIPATASNVFYFRSEYADAATAFDKVVKAKNISLIDLTATFGAGNEPTAAQMDTMMEQYPNSWFNTTAQMTTDIITYTQNSPSVTYPSPITSNLAAGTYKYTSTDGIYEFTLSDALRGIGTALDKVVFDRVSHNGVLEKRNARIASYNGESITTPYLSTTGALTTGAEVVYQLVTPTTAALVFTKVASSAATEVPMTFLTSTPSDDYPASREWVNLGYFIIVEAPRGIKTIPIKAYDRMVLTERPFYLAGVTFPCSISSALSDICLACSITTTGLSGTNSTITLAGIPESSRMTCRDAIGYLAMLCGKVARFSRAGVLEFVWYGTTPTVTITPALRDVLKVDPVQISLTGVEYVAVDSNNVQTTYRAGTNDYCLSLAENPFMLGQPVQAILDGIWADIGASSYYIFDCDMQGDPSFLATDCITVVLPDTTSINTIIMTHNYSYRGHSILSAEGRAVALAKYKPAAEKQLSAIAQQEQIAVQKLTTYQLAMLQLNEFSAQSTGLYPSSETLPDGSVIYYQHDHPLRADSIFIWRQTATTFTYSADGGVTWLGYDATGNILARVLNTIGINADWINAGVVNASRVSISGSSTYASGYDPSEAASAAEVARLAAAAAQTDADTAQTTANTGVTNAATAQTQANTATTNAATAQTAATNAATVAAAKNKTFYTQPAPPYYIGDVWQKQQVPVDVTDIVKCTVTRLTGAYTAADWANAYTLAEIAAMGSTIISGGHIITSLLTANNVTTGKMQSVDGGTYFDLDNSKILETAVIGGKTITVEISAAKPFELSIDGRPQIYVKNGILVTSIYDVNEDGYVDEADLDLVAYYVLHPSEQAAGLALYPKMDVNRSGTLSSSDLTLISRAAHTDARTLNGLRADEIACPPTINGSLIFSSTSSGTAQSSEIPVAGASGKTVTLIEGSIFNIRYFTSGELALFTVIKKQTGIVLQCGNATLLNEIGNKACDISLAVS